MTASLVEQHVQPIGPLKVVWSPRGGGVLHDWRDGNGQVALVVGLVGGLLLDILGRVTPGT